MCQAVFDHFFLVSFQCDMLYNSSKVVLEVVDCVRVDSGFPTLDTYSSKCRTIKCWQTSALQLKRIAECKVGHFKHFLRV